ncbi:MAG: MipA/OmpV family protein [Lautropia sp.]
MNSTDRASLLLCALFCLLSALPDRSSAQGVPTPGSRATNATSGADPDDEEPELDEVKFVLGTAVSVSPKYSGSDKIGFAIAPAGRIVWRGYSISTSSVARASSVAGSSRSAETGLSGPLVRRNRFAFGLGGSLNRGRNISEEDARLGLKDIPATLIGRLRLRYTFTPDVSVTALIVGDLLGRQKGLEIPVNLGWQHQLRPGLLLSSGVGVTWASATTLDNSYGIGEKEHAASGLPLYNPSSGFREISASIGLVGEPNQHWIWVARFSLVRLIGPAEKSPIVRQPLQPALLLGLAYRFTLH